MAFYGFTMPGPFRIPYYMRNFIEMVPSFFVPGVGHPFILNDCNQIIISRNRNADKKDIEEQIIEYLRKIKADTPIMTKAEYENYDITLHFSFPRECLPTTKQYISNLKKDVYSKDNNKLKTEVTDAARNKNFITKKYYKNNNINMITVYFDNHYKEIPFKGKPSLKYIKELFTNDFDMFEKQMIKK